jgi:hypothetical protein
LLEQQWKISDLEKEFEKSEQNIETELIASIGSSQTW